MLAKCTSTEVHLPDYHYQFLNMFRNIEDINELLNIHIHFAQKTVFTKIILPSIFITINFGTKL